MTIKNELIIGIVASLFICFMVFNKISNYNKNNSQTLVNTKKTTTLLLNLAEVSKHNTISDCWFIFENNVYDITSYFGSHPGGDQTMISSCGTDATVAYNTKGGRGKGHSVNADQDLEKYLLGKVGDAISK